MKKITWLWLLAAGLLLAAVLPWVTATVRSAAEGARIVLAADSCTDDNGNRFSTLPFYDEDTLASDNECGVASQQSVKAYIDNGPTVSGGATFSSTVVVGATLTAQSTITAAGDITVSADSTGGNAGAVSQIIGVPKITVVAAGSTEWTNGSTETTALMDDTPSGEWIALEVSAPDVTVADNSTIYRVGSKSLSITFGSTITAADGSTLYDGVTCNLTDDNWMSNESVGGWVYSTVALSAGDLVLGCYDGTSTNVANVPAVSSANTWTWVEVNIASIDCDMDTVAIVAGTTAVASQTVYLDNWYKWDATDEFSLRNAILTDGVLWVTKSIADGATVTVTNLTENTDFLVHYQSGDDAIVFITDQSAADGGGQVGIAME